MPRSGRWDSSTAASTPWLQIVEDFGVDVRSGLSASRVASSLSEFGRNELPEAEEG